MLNSCIVFNCLDLVSGFSHSLDFGIQRIQKSSQKHCLNFLSAPFVYYIFMRIGLWKGNRVNVCGCVFVNVLLLSLVISSNISHHQFTLLCLIFYIDIPLSRYTMPQGHKHIQLQNQEFLDVHFFSYLCITFSSLR